MKIHPTLTPFLLSFACAQTPAPKPAAPPKIAATAPKEAAAAKAPFAEMDPNRVIATIGTQKFTLGEFNAIVDGLQPQARAQVQGPGKRKFMEWLVQVKILAGEARKMHMDEKPEVKRQMEYSREGILANMVQQALVANAVADSESVQKYYDEHKTDYQQVLLHHVLIRFKGSPIPLKEGVKELSDEEALAKAKEVAKRLKGGEDFAAVAKAESADVSSSTQGGELPLIKHGQMPKPFDDAIFSLPPGQISDPVKTQFGYHVIRVDKVETKPLADIRAEVESKVKPLAAMKQLELWKKDMGVTLDDGYFGPPTPPAGETQPAK